MGLALGAGQSPSQRGYLGVLEAKWRVSGPCEGAEPRAAVTEVAKQDLARAHRSPGGQSKGPLAKGVRRGISPA